MGTEARYEGVKNKLNLRNLEDLTGGATGKDKQAAVHARVTSIMADLHFRPTFSLYLIPAKPGPSTRGDLGVLTFALGNDKFVFERMLKKARDQGITKAMTSRCQPSDHPATNLPKNSEIANRIKALYCQKLSKDVAEMKANGQVVEADTALRNWNITADYNLVVVQQHEFRPTFVIYWEFLCPTSNAVFIQYWPDKNPFDSPKYDFSKAIPNELIREKARLDVAYSKVYPNKSRGRQ